MTKSNRKISKRDVSWVLICIVLLGTAVLLYTVNRIGNNRGSVQDVEAEQRFNKENERQRIDINQRRNQRDALRKVSNYLHAKKNNIGFKDTQETDSPEKENRDLEAEDDTRKKFSTIYWKTAPEILEDIFESELSDDSYEKKETAIAKRELADEADFMGTSFESLECKESLCKTALLHENEADFKRFRNIGMFIEPWGQKRNFASTKKMKDGSGRYRTTIYYSKKDDDTPFKEMNERIVSSFKK